MDEDFDAYTLETREPALTEMIGQGNSTTRPTSWAQTSPPMDEDFDAWTYTNTAGPVTGTGTIYEEDEYAYRPHSEEDQEQRRERERERNSDRGYEEGSECSGDSRPRLKRRNRRKLGRSFPLTVSASRASGSSVHIHTQQNKNEKNHSNLYKAEEFHHPNAQEHGRFRERREVSEQSFSLLHRPDTTDLPSGTGQSRLKVTKSKSQTGSSATRVGNGLRKDAGAHGLRRRGSHVHQTITRRGPTHDYEVVDSRVLEEGPERTVTISTWREKVADEANRRSEVEMSVYYLNADDFFVERPGGNEQASLNSSGRNRSVKGKEKQRDLLDDGWRRSKPTYYRSASLPRACTPWLSGTNLVDATEEMSRVSKAKATTGSKDNNPIAEWIPQSGNPGPRTSTPVHRYRGQNSTGNRISVIDSKPMNGMHVSGSRHGAGSESSTITSMNIPDSAPALEVLLSSCEPSLLYLAPMLVGLGIRTKEHLRAVGKLGEETRNKEVREEALKRGMTNLEWAILLDRLRQNG
ncbi:hypothetical protein BDP27DRAFT_1328206 [Rhodocollybia butyracea]|uniref:Uncharacterized protein n=1 Tax=Rhodocollybia butyracea TaxID=206335 RepID=A0A9P5PTM2_9AGAR|nr:hypothetical protein BDP27DRAFT_1328206 [Rhodocollybia butyracea]